MFLHGLLTTALAACKFLLVSLLKLSPVVTLTICTAALFDSTLQLGEGQSDYMNGLLLCLASVSSALLWLLASWVYLSTNWLHCVIWRATNPRLFIQSRQEQNRSSNHG